MAISFKVLRDATVFHIAGLHAMKNYLIPLSSGIVTSVIGSAAYAGISQSEINPWIILIVFTLVFVMTFFFYKYRYKLTLLYYGGISAYYPRGQKDYIKTLRKDMEKSGSIRILGARGKDLIGEGSPISQKILELDDTVSVQVYLLDTESLHGRLRSGHLDVEKDIYRAQSESVHNYIKIMRDRFGKSISLYNYNSKPIFRCIILDEIAYVSIYKAGIRGRNLPCFRIRSSKGHLFDSIVGYLERIRITELAEASTREAGLKLEPDEVSHELDR